MRKYDSGSLRVIAASGSALPGELATHVMDTFGDVLYNLYGSTEVAWATVATPQDLRAAPGTAGRPPRGTVVRLYDADGEEVGPGETGRIFVGNELVFDGYTGGGSKAVIDGLVSSGDVGHFDEEGRLFVDGRDDEMIVSGGENVFPREVEDAIAALEGVDGRRRDRHRRAGFGQRLRVVRRAQRGIGAQRARRQGARAGPTSPASRSRATSSSSTSCRAPRPARCSSASSPSCPEPPERRTATASLERAMPARTDSFDLGRLRLTSGEGRRLVLEVGLDPLQFGGETYVVTPDAVEAILDISRTTHNGHALRLRFDASLRGPCMRCLEPAEPAISVDSREVDQPGDVEELRSPYVDDEVLDLHAWARDALALALPVAAAVPRRLRRPVPDLRHRPQRRRAGGRGSHARARARPALGQARRAEVRLATRSEAASGSSGSRGCRPPGEYTPSSGSGGSAAGGCA